MFVVDYIVFLLLSIMPHVAPYSRCEPCCIPIQFVYKKGRCFSCKPYVVKGQCRCVCRDRNNGRDTTIDGNNGLWICVCCYKEANEEDGGDLLFVSDPEDNDGGTAEGANAMKPLLGRQEASVNTTPQSVFIYKSMIVR